MLDVAFPLLAKVLGSEDDPLESIAVPHLLAIAYSVGWAGKMLSVVNPIDFAGQLEAAIEARGDIQDIGAAADTNLATAQGVASNSDSTGCDRSVCVDVWHHRLFRWTCDCTTRGGRRSP